MVVTVPIRSQPVESCAIDWVTFGYRFVRASDGEELLNDVYAMAMTILPEGEWHAPVPDRHYETRLRHDSGIAIRHSISGNVADLPDHKNPGGVAVDIPGLPLGTMTTTDRMESLLRLADRIGFKGAARIDFQRTWLDPPVTAEEVVRLTRELRLWAKGYSTIRDHAPMNAKGESAAPATVYFGSPASQKLVRLYNKAAEGRWPIPAVRVEVQHRKRIARHSWALLAKRYKEAEALGPLLDHVERDMTLDVIARDCDLKDTSQWAGRPRPKNWADAAPTPEWWAEMLGHVPKELPPAAKQDKDLPAATAQGVHQYGRTFALNAIANSLVHGTDLRLELGHLLMRFFSRLRDRDAETILRSHPELDPLLVQRVISENRGRSTKVLDDVVIPSEMETRSSNSG